MTKLIAIDDGHGMGTAGKRTALFTDGTKSPETGKNYMHENEFNRAVAKYLKEELERCGFRTVMVAPTDDDTSLANRVTAANSTKADFYVSIHANANTGQWGTWGGTETYTWPSGESLRIGKIVHKHIMGGTALRDRGVKNGDWLYVLKNTSMPAILIEAAYMDNLAEAKLLLSDAFRRETAREVAQGLCEGYGIKYVPKPTPAPAPSQPAPAPTNLYRVRKTWEDAASQIGAFSELDNAIDLAKSKSGYRVFDKAGKQVYPVNQIYRVRKSWADASSQIGAFAELANAKELVDRSPGYSAYDVSGKAVYSYVAPVVAKPAPAPTPAPTEPVKPVDPLPDLHEGHVNIMGTASATREQMIAFLEAKNPGFKDLAEAVDAYLSVGKKYGVKGDMAFCQSLIETGWFKFDGGTAVTPDQHNYCGMGVTSKGMKGNSFTTVEEGVTAQVQHLFAYASKNALPAGEAIVDPRFKYVTRGIAVHWEDLNNRWAMNNKYGQHIVALHKDLLLVVPPVKEEPKPEPTPEPKPEVPVEPTPVPTPDPVEEKVNVSLLNKVLQLLMDFLSGLVKKN